MDGCSTFFPLWPLPIMPPGVPVVPPALVASPLADHGAFHPPLLESTELTLEKKTGESEESDRVRETYRNSVLSNPNCSKKISS